MPVAPDHSTRKRLARSPWAAYAACAWAVVFALMSFYWASGGRAALETLGTGFVGSDGQAPADLITFTWITGFLKLLAAGVALALVQPWGRSAPRKLLLVGAWAAGGLFVLYALGNAVQHLLMLTGGLPVARTIGTLEAVRWHLFFWDPLWLVGGVLFLATARYAGRQREARA